MALNFRKFLDGIRIIPKTTSTSSESGDIEVLSSDNKTRLFNASQVTQNSPIVTEAHSATLTNKTLDSAVLIGPTTLDVNSASNALRITQTGSGNALLVEDSANPDSTPFVVNASGNVGIGTTAPGTKLHVSVGTDQNIRLSSSSGVAGIFVSNDAVTSNTPFIIQSSDLRIRTGVGVTDERLRIDSSGRLLQNTTATRSGLANLLVQEATGSASGVSVIRNSTDALGAPINLVKTRGTTIGAVDSVASGDVLGILSWYGADGTGTVEASRLSSEVDATPGTGNVAGRIRFLTRPAAGALTERLRITSTGNVGIGTINPVFPVDIHATGPGSILNLTATGTNNNAQLNLSPNGTGDGVVKANTNSLKFITANTDRVIINSAGNVGIGTTTPSSLLNISASGTNAVFLTDAYGTGSQPTIQGRMARGTFSSPTATQTSDQLLLVGGRGYGATGFSPSSSAALIFSAAEAFTDTARGSRISFETTPLGSTTRSFRMIIDPAGNVGIGTTAPATTLDLNGTFAIRFSNNTQTGASITLTAPTTSYVRLTAAVTSVGGIAGGVNGQRVVLVNRTGSTISINHEDAAVTAANRIVVGTAASFNLPLNGSIELVYDSTTSRWVVVGAASATTLVTTVSVNTVLTSLNDVVLVNASGAARTITLPAPVSGKRITVKKTDSSVNAVTISRSSTETIDGNASVSLPNQYDSYTVISDGTNWFII